MQSPHDWFLSTPICYSEVVCEEFFILLKTKILLVAVIKIFQLASSEEPAKTLILWRWRGLQIFFDKKWRSASLAAVWVVYVKLLFFTITLNEYNSRKNNVGFVFKNFYSEGLVYSIKKDLTWYIYYTNIDLQGPCLNIKHSCPPQNVLNVTACMHCITYTCISHVLTTCSTGIFVHENVLQNNIILLRRNYNENDMNSCPDMIKWKRLWHSVYNYRQT